MKLQLLIICISFGLLSAKLPLKKFKLTEGSEIPPQYHDQVSRLIITGLMQTYKEGLNGGPDDKELLWYASRKLLPNGEKSLASIYDKWNLDHPLMPLTPSYDGFIDASTIKEDLANAYISTKGFTEDELKQMHKKAQLTLEKAKKEVCESKGDKVKDSCPIEVMKALDQTEKDIITSIEPARQQSEGLVKRFVPVMALALIPVMISLFVLAAVLAGFMADRGNNAALTATQILLQILKKKPSASIKE